MTNEKNNQIEMKPVNMLDFPNIFGKSVKWVPVPVNEPLSCWFTRDLITPLYHNLNMSKNLYTRFNALYCFGNIEDGHMYLKRCCNLKLFYNKSEDRVYSTIPIVTDGENYYGAGGLQYIGTIFFTGQNTDKNHSEVYDIFDSGMVDWDYLCKVGVVTTGPQILFNQNDKQMAMKVKSVLDEAIEYYTLTNRGKGTNELLQDLIDRLYN